MSAIASVLDTMGHTVTGSDGARSATTDRLADAGITIHIGHAADHIGSAEMVAVSTAIPASNPEVREAERRGIPVLRRASLLASIAARRRTVVVAGTHGKTTTSSMLAMILVDAGAHPSFVIGGDIAPIGTGAAWDAGEWFVVEGDESDGTFLTIGAEAVIVTNVEPDHLEYWGGFEHLEAAFSRFVAEAVGPRVVCQDDTRAAVLAHRHGATTYGTSPEAEWRMVDVEVGGDATTFRVLRDGAEVAALTVPLPGVYNARNACAAFVMAVLLGTPVAAAAEALGRFGGVARRFQRRGEAAGVTFVDDYAHLPNEVAEVITAAKAGGWRRVVAVFQPHRYSRTATIGPTFGDAFVGADLLVVTDLYAAGEEPRAGVSGKIVLDAVLDAHPETAAVWMPGRDALVRYLAGSLRAGDLCLTLGAGDLTTVPDRVLPLLAARPPRP
jgi:UDP-N-acetylmuramate--alanine ligase